MTDIPQKFDSMRPYEDSELQPVLDSLWADAEFRHNLKKVMKPCPLWLLKCYLKRFKTIDGFQSGIVMPWIKSIVRKKSLGLDFDFPPMDSDSQGLLYISNHRDIVLDSALLDIILLGRGGHSAGIAIGNNLFVKPWIEKLAHLNRSFTVNRSATASELLESSKLLSEYIHFVITDRRMPVWIAQREGRAKDSNDRTQRSVLKMLTLGSTQPGVLESLASLHICPLSISYEYDPCDYLKAQEFQLKRDNPDYHKTGQDDMMNMKTGVFGFKGHIHYSTHGPIDSEIMQIDAQLPKNIMLDRVAAIIDRHIFDAYRIYPCNRVALDMLRGDNSQQGLYTSAERQAFEQYLEGQLAKVSIPNPDMAFLKERMLEMYANPLINQLEK